MNFIILSVVSIGVYFFVMMLRYKETGNYTIRGRNMHFVVMVEYKNMYNDTFWEEACLNTHRFDLYEPIPIEFKSRVEAKLFIQRRKSEL